MGIFDAIGNVIGSIVGMGEQKADRSQQMAIAEDQMNLQQAAAQHGIQWKVNDAASVGISPLAAIGASGVNISPVQVGDMGQRTAASSGLKALGSSLDDIFNKKSDTEEKMNALQMQKLQAEVDGLTLDNQHQALVNSDRARAGSPGTPPTYRVPLPTPDPRYTPAVLPATTRFLMPDGRIVTEPSAEYTRSTFATAPLGGARAASIETRDLSLPDVRPDVMRVLKNIGELPPYVGP